MHLSGKEAEEVSDRGANGRRVKAGLPSASHEHVRDAVEGKEDSHKAGDLGGKTGEYLRSQTSRNGRRTTKHRSAANR